MPTYELRCKECGHRFDRFLMRILQPADRVCRECGSHDVETGIGGGVIAARRQADEACAPRGGFS